MRRTSCSLVWNSLHTQTHRLPGFLGQTCTASRILFSSNPRSRVAFTVPRTSRCFSCAANENLGLTCVLRRRMGDDVSWPESVEFLGSIGLAIVRGVHPACQPKARSRMDIHVYTVEQTCTAHAHKHTYVPLRMTIQAEGSRTQARMQPAGHISKSFFRYLGQHHTRTAVPSSRRSKYRASAAPHLRRWSLKEWFDE